MVDAKQKRLRIGDLARETGKTARALRLYEETGLLQPTERTNAGYRLYNRGAIDRVLFIDELQSAGFSLADICDAIQLEANVALPKVAMARLRERFSQTLADVHAQLNKLERLKDNLSRSLAYLDECERCPVGAAPISACNGCENHDIETPQLIREANRYATHSTAKPRTS